MTRDLFPSQRTTERLVLEPLHAVDARTLYEHRKKNEAAGVYEHVPQSSYDTVKEAYDALADCETRWNDGEGARYAVRLTDDRSDRSDVRPFVGIADLHCEWERRSGHPGVVLARPQWGQGYARECFETLFALAFDRLDLELVTLHHQAGNARSKRAIERLCDRYGGQHDGLLRNWTPMDDGITDEHRYTITREQYYSSNPER